MNRPNDRPFNPLLFRLYASDLSEAVYQMGATAELRRALHRNDVQVRFGGGRQFVTMDGNTVELDANAPPEDVARALNVAKVDEAVNALSVAPVVTTAQPAALVVPRADDAPSSNITGLQCGAFQDALAEMRQKFANRQKQAVGKILNAVETGAAKMDAAADQVAAKVDKEISAALQEFSQYSNGGPV